MCVFRVGLSGVVECEAGTHLRFNRQIKNHMSSHERRDMRRRVISFFFFFFILRRRDREATCTSCGTSSSHVRRDKHRFIVAIFYSRKIFLTIARVLRLHLVRTRTYIAHQISSGRPLKGTSNVFNSVSFVDMEHSSPPASRKQEAKSSSPITS